MAVGPMQPLLRRKAARLDYALYSHFQRLACTLPALLLRHILPKWMLIMLVYNTIPHSPYANSYSFKGSTGGLASFRMTTNHARRTPRIVYELQEGNGYRPPNTTVRLELICRALGVGRWALGSP